MLWIPSGFAHGFLSLSDDTDLAYKCTDFYASQHERTIVWNDPELGIAWPLAADETPLVSPKDAVGQSLSTAEVFA
jgi:dTDP-4-dehydrorhamnose 3,5-epimerase